ncbi:MAG: nucleotide exchange factor GrpE [Chlamydiota bacterium]
MTEEEKNAQTSETKAAESSPAALSLEEELKECKDKYLRLLADMENTRKRLQKEKLDMNRFSIENLITEFLAPMDNLENALKFTGQMSKETSQWAMGFQMILTQFKDVLSNNGIISFDSEGTLFDPHKHQPIEVEETDAVPEGTILKEFVRGYRSGDRTIRPARVKIAKKPIET